LEILLENIGRRYNQEWIFRGLNHQFTAENPTVILGANGSGKSTLLQIILGIHTPSEGTITYSVEQKSINIEDVFRSFSFASPYMELFEELTLMEMLNFHSGFKQFVKGIDSENVVELLNLQKAKHKELKYYSSGMKQRVKLGLAILTDSAAILLDEPLSNLDKNGVAWYQSLIKEFAMNRLLIICSNHQPDEHFCCTKQVVMEDYKG